MKWVLISSSILRPISSWAHTHIFREQCSFHNTLKGFPLKLRKSPGSDIWADLTSIEWISCIIPLKFHNCMCQLIFMNCPNRITYIHLFRYAIIPITITIYLFVVTEILLLQFVWYLQINTVRIDSIYICSCGLYL